MNRKTHTTAVVIIPPRSRKALKELLHELQAGWLPPAFLVDEISLIWRNVSPDDAFRVAHTVRLGGGRHFPG